MLDINKELEKFNRLLEEVEQEEERDQAVTDDGAAKSGGAESRQSASSQVEPSSPTRDDKQQPARRSAAVEAPSAPPDAGRRRPVTRSPVTSSGREERRKNTTAPSGAPPTHVSDQGRSWTAVEHVPPDKGTERTRSDRAPAKKKQVLREVPRTVPSAPPPQHVAAFDSIIKGARTALTDSHRAKPKPAPPVTVTLPSPDELEEDLVRERGFREKIIPLVSARVDHFYDRMSSVQESLTVLEDRMSVVVGVAAAVVLIAAGLAIIPRMLSGDSAESAEIAAATQSDSVHLLSSADGLLGAETSSLTVSTFPPGARVYLGSELIGVTPFQGISVERGFQSITIKKADYVPVDTMLTMQGPTSLFFELEADPSSRLGYETNYGDDVLPQDESVRREREVSTLAEPIRPSSEEVTVAPPRRTAEPESLARRRTETTTPARSSTGSLVITSDPTGATVFVDDEAVGETPLTLGEIKAGRKRVTMQRDGYVPYEIELNVMPALQTPFHAVLAPMKGRIELRVASGADLYVDGALLQRSAQTGYVTVVNVGQRSIRLVHPQYGEWTTSVDIRMDETTPIEVNLEDVAFSAAVEEGDRLFRESQYTEALESYNRALAIRPGVRGVENKIGLAAKAMAESDVPSADDSGVYPMAETPPELIGGLQALHADVEYPREAYDAGVQGRVYVQFVVDENGRVQDPRIARGLPMGCNEAALRAVRRARFKPGLVDGRPVKVRQTLFVNFTID